LSKKVKGKVKEKFQETKGLAIKKKLKEIEVDW